MKINILVTIEGERDLFLLLSAQSIPLPPLTLIAEFREVNYERLGLDRKQWSGRVLKVEELKE